MKKLTDRQKEIYEFIYQYTSHENRPPTLIEIKEHFGFASNQGVVDHLKALEKKGYIKRQKKSRGIVLLKPWYPFPIMGNVVAGNPLATEEFHEGNLALENLFDEENCYVIRAKGDSMQNAGIFNEDFVIVRYQEQLENGEIGVILVDGEATIKRVLFQENKIVLQPENKHYSPLVIDPEKTYLRFCGKVIGVVRKI